MKIDRLMGILTVLLQRERVTAPELAERFEVSRRTINRDVEALCRAGIPVITIPGARGGISIACGYSIDRSLLKDDEIKAISAGLLSLDSVSGDDKYRLLRDKLFNRGGSSVMSADDNIMIDLSSWYKSSLAPKISVIRQSIEAGKEITFTYYSARGDQERRIEPYLLIFRWASWYVWGYCLKRQDFRMFKLNRMDALETSGRSFEKRDFSPPELESDRVFPNTFDAKVLIEPEMKWRVIEEFGGDSFIEAEDGRLLFSFGFHDRDSLFSWVMSFGDKAELLEPEEMRRDFKNFVKRIGRRYEDG